MQCYFKPLMHANYLKKFINAVVSNMSMHKNIKKKKEFKS